jgi:hypothetical protein
MSLAARSSTGKWLRAASLVAFVLFALPVQKAFAIDFSCLVAPDSSCKRTLYISGRWAETPLQPADLARDF